MASIASPQPVIAVDLGGTKIMAAVITPDGVILSRKYCPTMADKGPNEVIGRMVSAIRDVLSQSGMKTAEIAGITVAAAGALDFDKGIVTSSPNLPGWKNVPLKDIVYERFGVKMHLLNDANAAALGEHRCGAGKGLSHVIYITVSTGIGGGIIIDGELYSGADGTAGEIGHMTIEANGPQCQCGNFGCLEVLASGTAVAREAINRINQGEKSSLTELAGGGFENITAEIVAKAARRGDQLAREVVTNAAVYLGIGLANLVNIFNPDMIIIGGGMSKMGDMLLKPARQTVKQRAFQLPARTVRIVRAQLGGDVGIIGAAVAFFEKYTESN